VQKIEKKKKKKEGKPRRGSGAHAFRARLVQQHASHIVVHAWKRADCRKLGLRVQNKHCKGRQTLIPRSSERLRRFPRCASIRTSSYPTVRNAGASGNEEFAKFRRWQRKTLQTESDHVHCTGIICSVPVA
jgi:hypothetical protein